MLFGAQFSLILQASIRLSYDKLFGGLALVRTFWCILPAEFIEYLTIEYLVSLPERKFRENRALDRLTFPVSAEPTGDLLHWRHRASVVGNEGVDVAEYGKEK